MTYHVQCKLRKIVNLTEKGEYVRCYYQTSWIPEKFAFVDNYVRLQVEDGSWEDGWEVIEADIANKKDSKYINERSRDYKRTRKASDI